MKPHLRLELELVAPRTREAQPSPTSASRDFQRDCLAYRAQGLVECLADMRGIWSDERIVRFLCDGAADLKREREAL
jgi:hypothetical protein